MTNKLRRANATAAAQAYAPRPNGSAITYGFVAAALVLVVAFLAGAFFGADITANPLALLGLTIVAFVAGVALRMWRQIEHTRAASREYAKREPTATPAAAADTAAQEAQLWVTFAAPFLLPGLDAPHAPGHFEVRIRREALDVSWAAFVETRTILLTGNGSVEALDVKADDLEDALRRDRVTSEGTAET